MDWLVFIDRALNCYMHQMRGIDALQTSLALVVAEIVAATAEVVTVAVVVVVAAVVVEAAIFLLPMVVIVVSLGPTARNYASHTNWYQRGSPCQDPAGKWATQRPPDDRKETQTAVEWTCLPFIRSGHNHLARHSERRKRTRPTEEEVGRQHGGMDRPGVRQCWMDSTRVYIPAHARTAHKRLLQKRLEEDLC